VEVRSLLEASGMLLTSATAGGGPLLFGAGSMQQAVGSKVTGRGS